MGGTVSCLVVGTFEYVGLYAALLATAATAATVAAPKHVRQLKNKTRLQSH